MDICSWDQAQLIVNQQQIQAVTFQQLQLNKLNHWITNYKPAAQKNY